MKKIKYLLLILFVGIMFTGCGSSNLKSLSYSDLKDKLNNKESFFFIVIRDGCSYCESFVPKAEDVLNEYNIIGYKLNVSDLSDKEAEEFDKQWDVDGTPTTIFIVDGVEGSIMQRIDGSVSKEKLIDKLKQTGYIE